VIERNVSQFDADVRANAGYLYTTWWGPQDGLRAGIGVATFIVQRPDIANGVYDIHWLEKFLGKP